MVEVTSTTVQNCWHKTDILYHTQESEIQELEMPITTEILGELPANAQTLVQNFENYVIAVDELISTEDVLEDNEIVEMVLADAEIETGIIEDSEEELEESPPTLVTITEAYEALQKVMRFEEENSNIEKLQLFRRRLYDYGKMYENSKKQVSLDRYFVNNTSI